VLVGISYMYTYMAKQREAFLEYSDWMGILIIPYPVMLARLKTLLYPCFYKIVLIYPL
jgi:hypothetical protein